MPTRPENLIHALELTIRENHNCVPTHFRSIYVEETDADQILWKGFVEVFTLEGHAEAQIAYGWWEEEAEVNLVTILALTSTADARKAVQAYLMSQEED
jgi:hypothetical protein